MEDVDWANVALDASTRVIVIVEAFASRRWPRLRGLGISLGNRIGESRFIATLFETLREILPGAASRFLVGTTSVARRDEFALALRRRANREWRLASILAPARKLPKQISRPIVVRYFSYNVEKKERLRRRPQAV